LKYLSGNETAFNEYLKWKEIGIGDMGNTTIGRWWKQKYPLFCQVCMRLSQGNLHPGLDIDTCRPREYKDWNLLPPYGDNDRGDVYAEHYVEVDITHVWSIMGIILLVVLYCSFGHLLR